MSTATSLSVRALLNKAIAQTGLTGRRAISGLTLPAKALAVAATAHTSRDAVVLYVVPARSRSRGGGRRRALLPGRARSDVGRSGRGERPAVSLAASRSVSRDGAALPGDLGAGASPARGGARRRPASSWRRRRRCFRGSPRPNRSSPRRSICAAASKSIRWRWPTSSSAAATSARIRSTNTASSRCAAAFLTSFQREKPRLSASSSSATRLSRSAASIPARSDRSRPSISFRSCRSRSQRTTTGARSASTPSSTTCARRSRCASSCPSQTMCEPRRTSGSSKSVRRSKSASPTRRRPAVNAARRLS